VTSQSNSLSHFSISGIHGLPYVQWEGAGGTRPVQGSWGGYCTHGSVLFPTWHRPYIALYEVLSFTKLCIPEILTEFYSKYCSRTLLTSPERTRIHNTGSVWPRTSEHLIGTGLPIASRLPRLSLWQRSTSSRLMVGRLALITRFSNTLSIPSTRLSHLLIGLGGRQ